MSFLTSGISSVRLRPCTESNEPAQTVLELPSARRPGGHVHLRFPSSLPPLGQEQARGREASCQREREATPSSGEVSAERRRGLGTVLACCLPTLLCAGAGRVIPEAAFSSWFYYFEPVEVLGEWDSPAWVRRDCAEPSVWQARPAPGWENARESPGISKPGKGRAPGRHLAARPAPGPVHSGSDSRFSGSS